MDRLKKHYLFFVILLIAVFLRVYRLDILTTFGGDQGIDFLVVKDMVLHHKWTLLGIKTSIAPFFQGPLYLYLLFPFFALFKLQPIAGAVAAVFFSAATIIALYVTARRYFSQTVALFSTALFAVSPEFIAYGNTPLYQNFLPLFIILSLYLFLSGRKNIWTVVLSGLTVGLGMELHFLNVTLALSYFIFILFFDKQRLYKIGAYMAGMIFGLSPTIFFELRHNFLNTHLFLDYQKVHQAGNMLTDILLQWSKGAGMFLGGKSILLGALLLILVIFFVIKNKKMFSPHEDLRRLLLILLAVTFLLSLKLSSFQPHYVLPVWVIFLIIIPVIVGKAFNRQVSSIILGALLVFNLFVSVSQLGANHGYSMPPGWTLRKIDQIGLIISQDAHGTDYNVASLLDGNTRTYPVRYTTEVHGSKPDAVENYPSDDHLYVVFGADSGKLFKVTTWEVASLSPFKIGAKWFLGDGIYLYRLDRIKSVYL